MINLSNLRLAWNVLGVRPGDLANSPVRTYLWEKDVYSVSVGATTYLIDLQRKVIYDLGSYKMLRPEEVEAFWEEFTLRFT